MLVSTRLRSSKGMSGSVSRISARTLAGIIFRSFSDVSTGKFRRRTETPGGERCRSKQTDGVSTRFNKKEIFSAGTSSVSTTRVVMDTFEASAQSISTDTACTRCIIVSRSPRNIRSNTLAIGAPASNPASLSMGANMPKCTTLSGNGLFGTNQRNFRRLSASMPRSAKLSRTDDSLCKITNTVLGGAANAPHKRDGGTEQSTTTSLVGKHSDECVEVIWRSVCGNGWARKRSVEADEALDSVNLLRHKNPKQEQHELPFPNSKESFAITTQVGVTEMHTPTRIDLLEQ